MDRVRRRPTCAVQDSRLLMIRGTNNWFEQWSRKRDSGDLAFRLVYPLRGQVREGEKGREGGRERAG